VDVHLRDLRVFLAVAEEGSVTGAAQRLFVAQPALSKQLRALEHRIGVALFRRLPRGVALTEAGRVLEGPARTVLAVWDEAVGTVAELSRTTSITVGMQTAVGRGLQRGALARFADLAPGVVPSLRLVDWRDPTTGLGDGSSDVAFVWLPVPMDDVDVLPVASEERWVAMPADHPLAGRDRVGFGDLLDQPFVAMPEEAGPLRDAWLAVDARGGRAPLVGAVAATADAVLEAVAAGLGVVLLAAGNASLYERAGVVARPVDGLSPAVLALAWRASDRRPVVAAFVRAVDEQLTR
jgi:DNA-binding transcriptional LysR family regulator